jgi:hypothetical protein
LNWFHLPQKVFKVWSYLVAYCDLEKASITTSAWRISYGLTDMPHSNFGRKTVLKALEHLENHKYIRRRSLKSGQELIKLLRLYEEPLPNFKPYQPGEPKDDGRRRRAFIPSGVRYAVIRRDAGRCRYCGKTPKTIHLDHVIPWSRGGSDAVENLVSSCQSCNSRKRDRTPLEASMELIPVSGF